MKFGSLPLNEAIGAILAHGVKASGVVFKKGRILSHADIEVLRNAGFNHVVAAQLGQDDVGEDIAARQTAVAASGPGTKPQQAFTGRANLHSTEHGLVTVDEVRLRALNHLHESLTIATLPNHAHVKPKQMVATIKVIPFAIEKNILEKALATIGSEPLVRVAPFRPLQAGLVLTRLPQSKPTILEKSETVTRERLASLGATLAHVVSCDHTQQAVASAIADLNSRACDLILVFGASAIVDRGDVIPAGLVDAKGKVIHLGMPVDPGNLLMFGTLDATPVIGIPSCARSPKVNGFDWVLERVVAGLEITQSDIMDMGAGGLLAEISSRPTPREPKTQVAPTIAAIVLAAGKSSRMGTNKMLSAFHGAPVLAATVQNVLASSVDHVVVVTGHEHHQSEAAIAGLNVQIAHNRNFADGLSTSIRCGIEAVHGKCDAVIVCLGDMPLVSAEIIDQLISAFNPDEHRSIVVPVHHGQQGNPVLWGAEHFPTLLSLAGDKGARAAIATLKSEATEVVVNSDAILKDADTPEELRVMQQGT